MLLISELNPWLRKGRGIPVFGSMDVTTPIFINVWNANIAPIPEAISVPILSGAFAAVDRQ